jgi:uncharacterized protein DUF4331
MARKAIVAATAALVPAIALTVAGTIGSAVGADHLDAPGLTSPSSRPDADITDIYAFQGSDPSRTALVLDVGPGAGAIAPATFGTDVNYALNIDRNGDAKPDLVYNVRFGASNGSSQPWTITRYTGNNAQNKKAGVELGSGRTNDAAGSRLKGDGRAFAGLRSDPFFFDLVAFEHDVLGIATNRSLCDSSTNDFFAPLDVNAIVIEVPDDALGTQIGYWATTSGPQGRIDRMGRPAINTVFNRGNDKNTFNATDPVNDRAGFSTNVGNILRQFSALDTEGAYTDAQIQTLTNVLLPDVLTYDTSTPAAGPLNGRALSDDVIDGELNIVTGGFPFPGRDAHGAVPSDCVGPHADYMSAFPYVGAPHAS